MRTHWFLLAVIIHATGCGSSANPADCTDKRDIGACRKLCESGKEENRHFCFAERAFQLADCVDKSTGCEAACNEWTSREKLVKMGDTSTTDLFKMNIGAKYDQMASKCGAPGEPPADKPVADNPVADKPVADKPTTEGWTTYTSKEGKYTMEFPTAPTEKGQGGASMVTSEFGATEADARTAGCGMATTPVPNKDADPATMLGAMATGYKTDAKVLEEKDLTINGKYPGKHLVIENAKHRKWIRLYVIEDKLYIHNCGAPSDRGDKEAPIAMRVLESFKLTP